MNRAVWPDQFVNSHEQCNCSFAVLSSLGRLVLTIDSGLFAMDTIFNDVCVLVTAAFALTLVPGFRQPAHSLLSRRDQGTALLVFMSLGAARLAAVVKTKR